MKAVFEARRRARRNVRAGLGACAALVAGCFLAAATLAPTPLEAAADPVEAAR